MQLVRDRMASPLLLPLSHTGRENQSSHSICISAICLGMAGLHFKEEASMLDEFACDACGSPAVTYPDVPEEDAAVVCARCAAKICSYGDFRRRAEQMIRLSTDGAGVTGC